MKKNNLHLLLVFMLLSTTSMSQVPQAISYQAVARENSGNPISNQTVELRFTIRNSLTGGIALYQEVQTLVTNSLGLFTAKIGQGTTISGTFTSIDWGNGSKFLQVEMKPPGGTSYIDMGTQEMLSVPFALNAANGNWPKSGNDIYNSNGGSVGIGTIAPVTSAKLEVSSSTQGFLPPRLSLSQRNAIFNPVAGLQIWCLDLNCLQVYDGTTWMNIAPSPIVLPGVEICDEIWMKKNLDVATYRNGDSLLYITDVGQWFGTTLGAYCYYNNDSATYASVYGKLYNWYAVHDPRGLAPVGWHIPKAGEYGDMYYCLGGENIAGAKLKEAGLAHWAAPNAGATNSTGFTALPGGYRDEQGVFDRITEFGRWWYDAEDIQDDTKARAIWLS